MDDVVFRRAVVSDYSQLASMERSIFNGHDYLPHRYVDFMNNPNYNCYVLEMDGVIVAFNYMLLLDEGQTIYGGGLRVHPRYRRQGLPLKLQLMITQEWLQRGFPVVAYVFPFTVRYTAFDSQFQRDYIQADSSRQLLAKRAFLNYAVSAGKLRACCANQSLAKALTAASPQHVLHITSSDEAYRLLTDNVSCFPHATFMVKWEPYRILKSNVEYAMKNSHLFVSPSSVETGKCVAFSFVSLLRVEVGLRVDVEYYGVTEWMVVVQHVLTALHYLSKCSPLFHWAEDRHSVSVLIYCPDGIDRDSIGQFLTSHLGFTAGTLSSANSHYILVEMPVPLPAASL